MTQVKRIFIYSLFSIAIILIIIITVQAVIAEQEELEEELTITLEEAFIYRGVNYGMSSNKVVEKLGEPLEVISILEGNWGPILWDATVWIYKDYFIIIDNINDTVKTIHTEEIDHGLKKGDNYLKIIDYYGEGEIIPSPHGDRSYFTIHYNLDKDQMLWFFIGENKIQFIQIGVPYAD
ncbi:hypothetical protein SYNTR_0991 [Candidatus Syntrophocurvum alkaliphilum]|uniref:Uncharacterized protein n=1 Tax=Candidatus Syntrophocurvum alkaliphilum TaxID=2293317 RepID=A0A6I6DI44_9FIRM|nr:hypothetical protein [Candidatus Syntrophocurvum alkaliphilum]QGT99584.1 hypothetical protein SYNTR_0991 [Candidatus Syntrophocurvum alkaliphilum]